MTPIEQAASVYEREGFTRTFGEVVQDHFAWGYVISTPDLFCLAREANHTCPREWLLGEERAIADTWFVSLFAGDLSQVFRYCPSPKEWVAFERNHAVRLHGFESIRKRLM